MTARVSIGVAGSLGPALIAALAPAVERAGFAALWINDVPGGDALIALAAAAGTTEHLHLATGVIPVDRRSAASIADEIEQLGLPQNRLTVGIGAGARREGALARVDDATALLRRRLDARVVVGALGPRMRRLGARRAGGVLLNWVTPDDAARQTVDMHEEAAATHVALYVRTAVDADASPRLREEIARYAAYPNYAANFARMGVDAGETVLEGVDAARRSIPAYAAAVDEVVLRAITASDTLEDYLSFVDTASEVARTSP